MDLSGFGKLAGHSPGIVAAATIASTSAWDSLHYIMLGTLTILYWNRCCSQQTHPLISLAPNTLQDSIKEGEGTPSPMLSVRDQPQVQVQYSVDITCTYLPKDRHIHLSLMNDAMNVTGPPQSLYGLNLSLRKIKVPAGLYNNRVLLQRRARFTNPFLPISMSFDSPDLESVSGIILEDLKR